MILKSLLVALGLVGVCGATAVGQADGLTADSSLADLPLIEVRAQTTATPRGTLTLLITGDGGWASIDRELAKRLAANGIDVVGLDARKYLSKRRTPDGSAADAVRVLRFYMNRWRDQRVALVGYSRGADMLPFVMSRLPSDLRASLDLGAMLGLAPSASFEFHWDDLVRDVHRPTDIPVAPELEKLRGLRLLCVYGTDEAESGCRSADSTLVTRIARPGGHHFDHNDEALAAVVLSGFPRR